MLNQTSVSVSGMLANITMQTYTTYVALLICRNTNKVTEVVIGKI